MYQFDIYHLARILWHETKIWYFFFNCDTLNQCNAIEPKRPDVVLHFRHLTLAYKYELDSFTLFFVYFNDLIGLWTQNYLKLTSGLKIVFSIGKCTIKISMKITLLFLVKFNQVFLNLKKLQITFQIFIQFKSMAITSAYAFCRFSSNVIEGESLTASDCQMGWFVNFWAIYQSFSYNLILIKVILILKNVWIMSIVDQPFSWINLICTAQKHHKSTKTNCICSSLSQL